MRSLHYQRTEGRWSELFQAIGGIYETMRRRARVVWSTEEVDPTTEDLDTMTLHTAVNGSP